MDDEGVRIMAQPHAHEGTPRELASYLAKHPDRRFRLVELNEENERPTREGPAPVLDEKAEAALDLLDGWIAEGRAADEKTRLEADRELGEFKRNMNANRAATGERPVYP
jgi:hypothetical protein